ncbi:hypothetical protein PVAND_012595 [Polypedilum vanderplanki]|uniref:Odorant receptor n=1 Tax=Polypedilum vanderplanki TaxID=319348 RepID=A0A9J6CN01_POLVA|nr:hypothetical protein PVAND_012595 [Polypedilum vanderplanki]
MFFVFVLLDLIFYTLVNANYFIEILVTHEFELERFTSSFPFVAAILMLLTRYACIYFNKDVIQKILNSVPKEYNKLKLQQFKIDKLLMNFQRFIKFHRYLNLNAITYAFLMVTFSFIKTGQKNFPFEIKFPFDAFESGIYPILLIWVLFSHSLYAFTMVTTENVTYGLIIIVSAELKMLAADFRLLRKKSIDIVKCIKRQNELYDIVEELQRIFGIYFFINFLLSSILICFTAFTGTISPDPLSLIFSAIFCLLTMLQIFIQCFFGQILYDANLNLVDSIYECGWENMKDINLKKILILVIMRSQKCVAFSLFGFWKITLEQFQSVSF